MIVGTNMFTSGGKVKCDTCLTIDHDLKMRAKAAGINMTAILVKGLEKELKKVEGGNNGKKTKEK